MAKEITMYGNRWIRGVDGIWLDTLHPGQFFKIGMDNKGAGYEIRLEAESSYAVIADGFETSGEAQDKLDHFIQNISFGNKNA